MRDRIDERNEKERISRSIVKYWNVNYVPVIEEPDEAAKEQALDGSTMDEGELLSSVTDEFYNKATKSYSGTYGLEKPEDEVTKGQIDRILQEKDEALRQLLDEKTKDYSDEES